MKKDIHDMDDLLVKYLTHEATAAEQEAVQQWLQAAPQNRQYFEHFRLIWEESLRLAATTEVDEQEAWVRFQQRTQRKPATRDARLSSLTGRWLRVAAVLILTAGLAWLAWWLPGDPDTPLATLASKDEVRSDTLPDGSVITINKHSTITFPERFTANVRRVQLQGEGFFSVTPDRDKPFRVHTDHETVVEVVGTSFNIRNQADSTEVIVETGVVEVKWAQQTVSLKAGEKAVVKPGQGRIHKQPVTDRLYNYYQSNQFVCDNTPLWKLVQVLNQAYDAHIVIETDAIRDLPITTTFREESLEKILNIIRLTLDISVIKQDDTIILR